MRVFRYALFALGLMVVALAAPLTASALSIAVGGTVEVVNTGNLGLNLRASAATSAPVNANLRDGTKMSVTGGPVQKEGYVWWQLSGPQGSGWAAANWLRPVAATPPPPQPAPDPQLLAQVQQMRAAWQKLAAQVGQTSSLTAADQTALGQDLQRGGQILDAAAAAAQRGDRATAQAQLGEAQRALSAVGQRLAQIAQRPPPPPVARIDLTVEGKRGQEGQEVRVEVPRGGQANARVTAERSSAGAGSQIVLYQWHVNGQPAGAYSTPPARIERRLPAGTYEFRLVVRDNRGQDGQVAAARVVVTEASPPPITGQIIGVQPQASPEGVALIARVKTTGPLYLGCSFRVRGNVVHQPAQRVEGDRQIEACRLSYRQAGIQPPAMGQSPLPVEATLALWRQPPTGQPQPEVARWGWQVVVQIPPVNQPPVARIDATAAGQRAQEGQELRVSVPVGGEVAVTLSGGRSQDPEGQLAQWEWASGGRGIGSGREITRPFRAGTHVVMLTVRDAQGAGAQAQVRVVVTEAPPPPPPTPAVSGINPNPVPGLDGWQTLTLTGSGFAPGAQVTLRTGGEVFVIPPDRTTVVSPTQIQVRVNVTRQVAPWTAEVTNPGNRVSNRLSFAVVVAQPPAPPPAQPDAQLLAQVQQVRAAWQQLTAQVNQASALTAADRAALGQDLQRGGQALDAAAAAAQRGDRATAQAQLQQAQQVLSAVSQRLAQLARPPVPPGNQPPVARIDATAAGQRAQEGQELRITVPRGTQASMAFSAARSSDSDGRVTYYRWELDGKVQSAERDFSHSLAPGTYVVGLTVRDDKGGEASARARLVITEQAPETASPCPPFPATAGNPFEPRFRGYCTWYAAERWLRAGLSPLPSIRDATHWLDDARSKGFQTGPTPVPGSLMVLGPTADNAAGHVAHVETVDERAGTFTVSEMNWGPLVDRQNIKTSNFCKVTPRTLAVARVPGLLGFIYPTKAPIVQPPAGGPSVTVRFTKVAPPRVLVVTPTAFTWEGGTPGLEYRYKIDVPGDWTAGLRYILNKWAPWASVQSITYSDFIIEGDYAFSIQARDPRTGRESAVVMHRFSVYFQMPELFQEAVQIDWAKARGAPTKRQQFEILAREFEAAHRAWMQRFDYQRRVLKSTVEPTWFRDQVAEILKDKIIGDAQGALLQWADKGVAKLVKELLRPVELYQFVRKAGDIAGKDLILLFRNLEANKAASMSILTYYGWKGYERLAQQAGPVPVVETARSIPSIRRVFVADERGIERAQFAVGDTVRCAAEYDTTTSTGVGPGPYVLRWYVYDPQRPGRTVWDKVEWTTALVRRAERAPERGLVHWQAYRAARPGSLVCRVAGFEGEQDPGVNAERFPARYSSQEAAFAIAAGPPPGTPPGTTPPPAVVTPEIAVAPSTAREGDTIGVTGRGFTPGGTATVTLRHSGGAQGPPSQVRVDPQGKVDATYSIPIGSPSGRYSVAAIDDRARRWSNAVALSVTPAVSAAPTTPTPPASVVLSVAKAGSGSGRVTSEPPGITCAGGDADVCSQSFLQGSTVTLRATPAGVNDAFGGWSGDCVGTSPTCTLSLTKARRVGAMFNVSSLSPPAPLTTNQPPVARIDATSENQRAQEGQELRVTVPPGGGGSGDSLGCTEPGSRGTTGAVCVGNRREDSRDGSRDHAAISGGHPRGRADRTGRRRSHGAGANACVGDGSGTAEAARCDPDSGFRRLAEAVGGPSGRVSRSPSSLSRGMYREPGWSLLTEANSV